MKLNEVPDDNLFYTYITRLRRLERIRDQLQIAKYLCIVIIGAPYLLYQWIKLRNYEKKYGSYTTLRKQVKSIKEKFELNLYIWLNRIVNELKNYQLYLSHTTIVQIKEVYARIDSNSREHSSTIINQVKEIDWLTDPEKIEDYNERYISKNRNRYESLLGPMKFADGTIREHPLNENQQEAVIAEEDTIRVIAGAGSGKTEILTTKIAYLVKRDFHRIPQERILAVAFQRKAREEMQKRLKDRYDLSKVDVQTFNSLGVKIGGYQNILYDNDAERWISDCIEEQLEEENFSQQVTEFLVEELLQNEFKMVVDEFSSPEEIIKYYGEQHYRTVDGLTVKSWAEKAIYDTLIILEINGKKMLQSEGDNLLRYEHPCDWMEYSTSSGGKRKTRPDFYLTPFRIYWEHWSHDKNGNYPSFMTASQIERYEYGKKKKLQQYQQLTEERQCYLIETNSSDFFDNINTPGKLRRVLIKKLQEGLAAQGIYPVIKAVPPEELKQTLWKRFEEQKEALFKAVVNYIRISKTYLLDKAKRDEIYRDASGKLQVFNKMANFLYEKFEERLEIEKKVQFIDQLINAIDALRDDPMLLYDTYDYILVDEFQDISKVRFVLIKLLLKRNRANLFVVGDDWQSIYGFTGADYQMFTNIDRELAHTKDIKLKYNYRSTVDIVNISQFTIERNTRQLQKRVEAAIEERNAVRLIGVRTEKQYRYNMMVASKVGEMITKYIQDGGNPNDILILHRYTRKAYKSLYWNIDENIRKSELRLCDESMCLKRKDRIHRNSHVEVMTIQKAKGLEAEIVIVLDLNDTFFAFPSVFSGNYLLKPLNQKLRVYSQEEEERRILYVALSRPKFSLNIFFWEEERSIFATELEELNRTEYLTQYELSADGMFQVEYETEKTLIENTK